MRDPENIHAIAAMKPDYMGFIFYKPSPRYVGDNFSMPEGIDQSIRKTGVFVNGKTEDIVRTARKNHLDAIQLHGDETANDAAALRSEGLTVIKVFRVGRDFSMKTLATYDGAADFFMFDTRGKLFGGNARKFDWTILESYLLDTPLFLSGGLSPEDVLTVGQLTCPGIAAVDLNSGVELAPGLKDPQKVKAAIEVTRNIGRQK
jgi:phosphoribosylanthranilate isomerase